MKGFGDSNRKYVNNFAGWKVFGPWQSMQIGNILKLFMEQEKPIPIQSKILLPQVANNL